MENSWLREREEERALKGTEIYNNSGIAAIVYCFQYKVSDFLRCFVHTQHKTSIFIVKRTESNKKTRAELCRQKPKHSSVNDLVAHWHRARARKQISHLPA